jgi:hypothetical protein
MPVGVDEPDDYRSEKGGQIVIDRKTYTFSSVYSETGDMTRDVFVPDEAIDRAGGSRKLPETATVHYNGHSYTARKSFSYGAQGQSIPVYRFETDTPAGR